MSTVSLLSLSMFSESDTKSGHKDALVPEEKEASKVVISKRATPVNTENLLSRVNNSNSGDRTAEEENGFCEDKPNSGVKLHQLLDANPRAILLLHQQQH